METAVIEEERPAEPHSRAAQVPTRSADEFEADTQENRPVSVLAEKRRQFLARLQEQNHVS